MQVTIGSSYLSNKFTLGEIIEDAIRILREQFKISSLTTSECFSLRKLSQEIVEKAVEEVQFSGIPSLSNHPVNA